MKSFVTALLFFALSVASPFQGELQAETGWTTRVVKVGEDRVTSDATHILQRPNRPLHFYGNTVRRNHYRGNPMPTLEDVGNTVVHLIRR